MSIRIEEAARAAQDLRRFLVKRAGQFTVGPGMVARAWTWGYIDTVLRGTPGITDHERAERAAGILDACDTVLKEIQ